MTKELDKKLNEPIQSIKTSLEEVIKSVETAERIEGNFLDAICKDMKTLKFRIPPFHKFSLAGNTARLIDRGSETPRQSEFKLPNLYADKVFDESPAFIEIQEMYNNGFSDDICKKCFLYFAVFPENVVLKKRFLTHWWIGEGLLNPLGSGDQTPEVLAGKILKEFAEKGLIVPVKEEQKVTKKKFRIPLLCVLLPLNWP